MVVVNTVALGSRKQAQHVDEDGGKEGGVRMRLSKAGGGMMMRMRGGMRKTKSKRMREKRDLSLDVLTLI